TLSFEDLKKAPWYGNIIKSKREIVLIPPHYSNKWISNDKKDDYEKINIYKEQEDCFKNLIRHKIRVDFINNFKRDKNGKFDLGEEKIKQILNQAENGKRVLVILNTVSQAQDVYEKLIKLNRPNIKIFLLHSRFSLEDRKLKEVNILNNEFKNPKPLKEKEGKILITTQVVEASLNIDADVLFTEICPLDSLVQRMGRVVRRVGPNFEIESQNFEKRIYKNRFKDERYEVDLSQPNVNIWIFKNGLESGNGQVYERELLRLSIAWLWKKSYAKNISKLDFTEENKKEFFEKEFKDLVKKVPKHEKETKEKQEDLLNKILNRDEWLDEITIKDFEINELEKYLLVDKFYSSLLKEGKYLRDFYNTIEVLEAGYMSDRKLDAERIFREIYDVSGIPENKLEKFYKSIKEFVNLHNIYEKGLFSLFKKNVLSKFIVSIPYNEKLLHPQPLCEKISLSIENEWDSKIKNYLSNLYVLKVIYDKDKGVLINNGSTIKDEDLKRFI
ncbi:MAG: CRISPR-associated helicase Cas3', partial [Caldisericia bacterium]|nr:CRISPR-associated helicase Cas3' [Caldisericia bacterium]